MIISVHLPKTAGTSFGASLEAHFGSRLVKDYGDFPVNTPPLERNRAAMHASLRHADADFGEAACLHGHFLPIKYLLLASKRDVTFVTWMRHPVERVLSHYDYWNRSHAPGTAARLHDRFVEESWSVERFCLGPELRDVYAQCLWGFPLEGFDFIGITEFYAEDFAFFSRRYLDGAAEGKTLNVAEESGRAVQRADVVLRRRIEEFHSRDMDLYRRALEMRQMRKAI